MSDYYDDYNVDYEFVYTVKGSSKINSYETTINTANGGVKEAFIELKKAVPDIVDYFLIGEIKFKYRIDDDGWED